MTQTQLETLVVASILTDDQSQKPGPVISMALAYSDYWQSVEAGKLAKGVFKVTSRGMVPSRPMIRAMVEPEYRDWIDHPMFNDGLPLWIVEFKAKELLPYYRNKRLVEVVARTYEKMIDKPEAARELAMALKLQLEDWV